ncbi:flagellar motor switch protein FliN [Desulfurivibrio alkaliphilus]|uniref:Flagellar motor switch protein FliN n=1 Tax=Desulfurivibrio alkaliphilus (strain DSM 19089 / UNIQEM U267 / AHT2) TaxID=589865 RepID=D6Z4D3_DESAT|nr:flagellar motor switch protein FliN [Desulfurivibrio alkaliphilus]ADH86408.1 flagellar motor switch protein FliN [Desulfurivibrio alkaliphilus AHT 2]
MADEATTNKPEEAGDDWTSALADQNDKPDFDELSADAGSPAPSTASTGSQNLDFLLDVPLEVSVELGRTSMIINKMLQLTQGSVIELDKAAGEPVEIFVNQKLMGKGEVVVVNERFGIRVTEIISQADRIKNIG